MKIPKLFKKAAAFVMAAVMALSIMPATAFAAGDIGTISFSHTYDSNSNAMRYNSSANIGGYTAGGTGNYKYRMFVDGENAFCIQPGVPLKTGNTLKKASSDTWNALSANQKKAVGLALLYGYQGNRNNLSGSDDEKWLATQTLVWEFVTGCRDATGSYNQTSTTVYSLHFGSNYANGGARAVYDQIVAMLREHNTIPSFMSGGKNDITKELAYKDGKYSITLTDSNGVLSDYSFSSSDSNVSVSKSGNKLTISSTVAISGSVRITAKRSNVPTVSSSAKLIAYGDPNLQDLVTGVENADTVSAYINIETPTGTIALKKTSEDGVVEGISFMGCCMYNLENNIPVEVRGCTAFAYSSNGRTIYGRNNDLPPYLRGGSKSEIYAPKNGNRFNITTSSFINGEEGVNEHGLAVAMTFVMTDLEKIKAGFNSCFIVRYLLEKAGNTEQAVSLLMGLPVASNCNILLADKKGNMVEVECTPILKKVRAAEAFVNGSIVCTVNSFTSNEMKPYDDANGNDYDSHKRYRTVIDSFSSERIKDEYIETTQHLLKGDYGFMCQYDNEPDFETVWSSIFDLDSLVIYRAEGDPRKNKFVTDSRLYNLIRRG